jgi:hypothetical protein
MAQRETARTCGSAQDRRVGIVVLCVLGTMLLAPPMVFGDPQSLEGHWVGAMLADAKQGDAEITIEQKNGQYSASYTGLPSFSGPLYNVQQKPGKKPGSVLLTMVSAAKAGNILRFYLMKETDKPQLYGVAKLDKETGTDMTFQVVMERQPCCDPKCIHPGKSRCSR